MGEQRRTHPSFDAAFSGANPSFLQLVEQRTVAVMVTVTDANGTVVTDRHEVVVNQ